MFFFKIVLSFFFLFTKFFKNLVKLNFFLSIFQFFKKFILFFFRFKNIYIFNHFFFIRKLVLLNQYNSSFVRLLFLKRLQLRKIKFLFFFLFYKKKRFYFKKLNKLFVLVNKRKKQTSFFKVHRNFLLRYFFFFKGKKRKFRLPFFTKLVFVSQKLKHYNFRFLRFVFYSNFFLKKSVVSLMLGWSRFLNDNFKGLKKIYRRRIVKIATFNISFLNKNLIVFLNLFKYKKRPYSKSFFKRIESGSSILFRINKYKSISRIYKHLTNTLFSFIFMRYWISIYKIPLTFKVNLSFSWRQRAWSRLFSIFKSNFFLKRYVNSRYFSSSLLSVLASFYYKNSNSLVSNLSENLEKLWRHRQFLFFFSYLITAVLWQFQLKKMTSFKKIKTVYLAVRGKINSGTRTKYFQIKSLYKPSLLTLKNHMNYSRAISNARTGTFGIQSWIHY